MKLQTKVVTPWRRVPKPVMKAPSVSMLTSKPPAPPKVPPKPGSKVYLYVYDSEPDNPAAEPQYYQNPHFLQQQVSRDEVKYPYAKEKKSRENPSKGQAPQQSGKDRIRNQGQKSEKGYKVLAEVTPQLRSSSRGGKMFIKQKQRMDKYTKESQNFVQDDEEELNRRNKDFQGATDRWATPWNMAVKSPTAVKYITAKRLPGPMNRGTGFRDPTGFLPKPPELWRAKVEQDYPHNGPRRPLYKPVSTYWHNVSHGRSATPTEVNGTQLRRPDSAPPLDSPVNYGDQNINPLNDIYSENTNNGYFSEYDVPSRPASVTLPSATIHFNAKHYYNAPHRRQGLRRGAQTYTTKPYVQRDFNARAKGWHRYY